MAPPAAGASPAASSTQPGPVLVHDGAAQPAPASPALLLEQQRQFSYTTALARDGWLLVDWPLHLQRLVRCALVSAAQHRTASAARKPLARGLSCVRLHRNIQLMARERPPAYAAFNQWLAAAGKQVRRQ